VTGVGKTTFGAGMPRPLFICAEDGARYLGVDRYHPGSWSELLEFLEDIKKEEKYQTIVVDSIDHLEPLVWDHVCEQPDDRGRKHPHISAWPYGQGYARALTEWRNFLARLDRLTKVGLRVCLIAHTSVRPFKNPVGEDYDRYEIKLHKGASAVVQEWADVVGFAAFADINPIRQDGRKKAPDGASRTLYLERRAAWDAKARFDAPSQVELEWLSLAKLIPGEPAHELGSAIKNQLSGDTLDKAQAAYNRAKTQRDLAILAEKIKLHIQKGK